MRQLNLIKKQQISIDLPLTEDGDNSFTLADLILPENFSSPDNNLLNESVVTNISGALNKLTEREAGVLTLSFGLQNTPVYSLQEIGLKYEITSERVRQIETRGLLKLKYMHKGYMIT